MRCQQLVLGSDKIASLRSPLLLLTALLKKPDGTKEELVIEMTKEELDSFIASCAAINTTLQSLAC
jgi:hypothetical protein